jgi:hypothetical protein
MVRSKVMHKGQVNRYSLHTDGSLVGYICYREIFFATYPNQPTHAKNYIYI